MAIGGHALMTFVMMMLQPPGFTLPLLFVVAAGALLAAVLRYGRTPGAPPAAWTVADAITGLLDSVGRWRRRTLCARHRLFDELSDGVLVIDASGRLADANPAALALLGASSAALIGHHAEAALAAWPALAAACRGQRAGEIEIHGPGAPARVIEGRAVPLDSQAAWAVLLRDVTERHAAEQALRAANKQLQARRAEAEQVQAALREQAIRDPLTDLFNRRYLEETLVRELARAARDGQPVSLVILDVDNFKALNDTHGHQAGDALLRRLAEVLCRETRASDAACRYGGEEFVVVLPGTPLATAQDRAEQWRAAFAGLPETIRTTVSVGVACCVPTATTPLDQQAAALLRAADRALYAAKAAGRNQVVAA